MFMILQAERAKKNWTLDFSFLKHFLDLFIEVKLWQ